MTRTQNNKMNNKPLSRLRNFGIPITLVLLCGLLFSPTAFSAEETAPPATLDELKAAVANVLETHRVPAVGIAMVNADGPVWVEALGKADIERNIEADGETLFRIGSVSKMFAGLAALKLVEDGRLSLDDKVA